MDIINYFVDRQTTKKVLIDIENKVIKKCLCCKKCNDCQKFKTYKNEFSKKGFWTCNKNIRYWDIYDPDYSKRNKLFTIEPIRDVRIRLFF